MITDECAEYCEKTFLHESEFDLSRKELETGHFNARQRFRDITNEDVKTAIRRFHPQTLQDLLFSIERTVHPNADQQARLWGFENALHCRQHADHLHELTVRMGQGEMFKKEELFW